MTRLAVYPLLAVCGWGVLAIGAVYPWGYWPLAVGGLIVAMAMMTDARVRSDLRRQPLLVPLACLFGAIALQLVPLPARLLESVSPAAMPLLADYSVTYFAKPVAHPVSIAPAATSLALALGLTWAFLMLVLASWLSVVGPARLVVGLVTLGVVVALIGIAQQRPCHACPIYGWWQPIGKGISFAPFVNRNHYAGAMVMMLPLGLGLVSSSLAGALPRKVRTWRDYLRWASGAEANGVVLSTISVALMTLAVVLSGSRSGALGLAIAVAAIVHALIRRREGARRSFAAVYVVAIAVLALLWIGPAAVAQGYERSWEEWSHVGGRVGPWRDALSVIGDFPVAGTGLNTYGAAMLFYQRYDLRSHYSAAHSDYLQLVAEGGLLLAIPAVGVLAALVGAIRRGLTEDEQRDSSNAHWIRTGAVAGLMAIGFQELVDFSLQIPGNAVLFVCLCAIAVHKSPADSSTPPLRRRAHVTRIFSRGGRRARLAP